MNFKEIPLKEFYAKRLSASLGRDDSTQKPWYAIRNASDQETEVSIFDFIGLYGVTASEFVGALREMQDVHLRLNSPGGDVFDGIAIYNSLRDHQGRVRVTVDGIAASAASLIAMAGETVTMNQGAMMMIHDAWALTVGDAEDHLQMADTLNRVSGELAGIYAQRTGTGTRVVRQMMKETTWMTAKEAEEAGFADVVDAQPAAKAATPIFTVPQGFTLTGVDATSLAAAADPIQAASASDWGRPRRLALAVRGERTRA